MFVGSLGYLQIFDDDKVVIKGKKIDTMYALK